jgi:zinc/manganese transport system substrate-binding protein
LGLRIVIALAAALVLGGGIASGLVLGSGRAGQASGSRLQVVAAENVYGDIARQIGGDRVEVASILTDPAADPHLFEPGTRTGLAVARAALVVQNGLGYDAFMDRLEAAAPAPLRRVVTVADALGVHGDANPHLWYDMPRLDEIAAAVAAGLEQADPGHAEDYRAGLRRFDASLAPLRKAVARIRSRFAGLPVAYTEPVPAYLVEAAGLTDRTPAAFARGIEEGREPPPGAVSELAALVSQRRIRVLLYNSQAASAVTRRLLADARKAGVPVVAVTETLPAGRSFQGWQLAQAQAIERALSR